MRRPAPNQWALLGIFPYLDGLLAAIEAMRRARLKVLTVYTPVPRHEILAALGLKPSPVRFFTLLGGIAGLATGLGLAVHAGLQWQFITGGKPVMAWIPFMVIGFEFTILFGIFGNLAGMLLRARLPRLRLPDHYDDRFTRDRFGIVIHCEEHQRDAVAGMLEAAGAEEVREVER